MAVQKKIYSSAEFWEFTQQPEQTDRFWERIDGELFELMATNPYSSAVAGEFYFRFKLYLRENPIAHATVADGGYEFTPDDTFAPDVAIILKSRQPVLPKEGFNPIPPDLAVEVISPSDLKNRKARIDTKLEKYQEVGVPIVWLVYTERREVEVYRPGKPLEIVGLDGVLDAGDLLPGFILSLNDIFGE
ncbi:MAG: Uma2 family endonuclease [bacterium]|nr:Uma2 family endonuclease [bacterium]